MAQQPKTLKDLVAELHKDPEHQKQYRLQKPFYDLTLEILKRRKQLGLTQKDLADRVGTHQSAISRIEAAENDVRLSTLAQIAEALDAWLEIKLIPNLHLKDEDYNLSTYLSTNGTPMDIQVWQDSHGLPSTAGEKARKLCQAGLVPGATQPGGYRTPWHLTEDSIAYLDQLVDGGYFDAFRIE